jgi:hypothetical protein
MQSASINSDISGWYLRALALALTERIISEEPLAVDTLGKLLERSREDYAARDGLIPIFAMWREISRAPVHKVQGSPIWSS